RALDLGLQLDVLAKEVVVALAERLGVAALLRLGSPGVGELVHAGEQLARFGERLDDRARAALLDEIDVAIIGWAAEREHDGVGLLVADRTRDGLAGQIAQVLGDHRVMELTGACAIESLAAGAGVVPQETLRLGGLQRG